VLIFALETKSRPTRRKTGRDCEDLCMSGIAAPRGLPSLRTRSTTAATRTAAAPDARRVLQLALAGLWLLDGILQFQPYMFTTNFARQVLAPAAAGNPAFVAGPITARHSVGANAGFAVTQLILGLAIAWRPTVKVALAASVVWALSVWWLGEGLGGVLTGQAGPVAGGPGAALLYAVLAVLLWPPRETLSAQPSFVAAGRIGASRARWAWFVLWAALAGFAVQGTNRSAQGLHDILTGMATGQPAWLAAIGDHAAAAVAGRGLAVSIGLAVVLAAIALGEFGSPAVVRVTVIVAVGFAAVLWITAQALGGMFGGQGTDPDTGPLLMLIALAYWPFTSAAPSDARTESTC
jgi:hypothetical protein